MDPQQPVKQIEPKRASIWGSTNKAEFLTDVTGSVRWLCFRVREINWDYKKHFDIDRFGHRPTSFISQILSTK